MPLWADALAEQPDRGFDDVFAEIVPEEPEETPRDSPLSALRVPAAFVTAVVLTAAAVATSTRDIDVTFTEVPSAWGQVPMECATTRLEQGPRALELFRCRAVGAGRLPPGRYGSPESQWTSDITRVDAVVSRIVIERSGQMEGWAVY